MTRPNPPAKFDEATYNIRAEQVRLLYDQAVPGFLLTLLVAVVLGLVLLSEASVSTIALWWVAMMLTIAGRFGLVLRYRKATDSNPRPSYWARRFLIGATLTGLTWGVGGATLLAQVSTFYQVLTLLVIAAMLSSAIPYLGSVLNTYLGYLLAGGVPAVLWSSLQGYPDTPAIPLFGCLYLAGMWLAAVKFNRNLTNSLSIRAKNLSLARNLEHTNRELEEQLAERGAAQEAQRQSEDRFRGSFENALVSMAILSADGNFLQVNPAYCQFVGYPKEELLSQHYRLVIHPQDYEIVTSRLRQLQDGETESSQHQRRYRHKDGHDIWGLASLALLHAPNGRADSFIVQVQDITEHKEIERALRESDARLKVIADLTPAVICLKDLKGKYIFVNRQFERLHNLDPGEAMGKTAQELFPDEIADPFSVHDQDVLVGRAPIEREQRLLTQEGYRTYIEVKFPILDADDQPFAVGLVGTDITERKQTETDRLAHVMRQRDVLVREVHHRIKNNLQGVVGLLRSHGRNNPSIATSLDKAVTQVGAIAVVHGVHAESRGEAVNLATLVSSIADAIPRPDEMTVTTRTTGDWAQGAELSEAEAVPSALIINELITNAVKHGGSTSIACVHVTLDCDGVTARVRVANSFGTLPSGFDFKGDNHLGTGLELVKSLLPPMGAELSFRSRGEGVVAELTLTAPVIVFEKELMNETDSTIPTASQPSGINNSP